MPLRYGISRLARLVGLACLALLALPALPAHAAGGADLTVTLASDPATPVGGKHVSYRVQVHNLGPDTAAKVSIDFTTTAALTSPTWSVSTGRCLRSPAETACLFGTMKAGATAWATIGGVMPKDLHPGAQIENSVKVASDTAIVNPEHAVATVTYQVPGGRPSAAPSPSPAAATSAPVAAPAARHVSPLWMVVAVGGFAIGLAAGSLALALWLRSRA